MKADPYGLKAPQTVADLDAAARHLGLPRKRLLVLDPSNDPFNAGTPAKIRDAEWFVQLWERFGFTSEVHIRRIHYRAQSGGDVLMPNGETYVNTEWCWRTLENGAKFARDLALIDPERFADRRNPASLLYVQPRYSEPEPAAEVVYGTYDTEPLGGSMRWRLPEVSMLSLEAFRFSTGKVEVAGYDYNPADQPYQLEMWVEKSTMNDVIAPLCQAVGATFTPGTGFTSKTRIAEMLRRARTHGRPVRVFIIADYDPAGSAMPAAIARNLEFYRDRIAPDVEVAVHHVGMTRTWAQRYDLPRAPIKDDDNRKANFEARHGEGCVELDALEALHPGALRREIRTELAAYLDDQLETRLEGMERLALRSANEQWHATTAEIRAELETIHGEVEQVADRYRERLAALAEELAAEMEPHRDRLGELWTELVELAEDPIPVGLPARPAGQADGSDESSWLYDSRRHWWDQLQRYHAEKNGQHS